MKTPRCSFCDKSAEEVVQLITGPGVYICDECIRSCYEMLEHKENTIKGPHPKPAQILAFLDKYVIGQQEAKKVLSVAIYNHYKRVFSRTKLTKSNILLIGPTGTGKTLLARTAARLLRVPFAIADASSLTQTGYVGDSVDSVLLRLLHAADFDVAKAERGIVYIDEFDKLARRHDPYGRDIAGEGVQQELLKILEGTIVNVSTSRKFFNESLQLDTSQILFICGGAFTGLKKTHPIGFTSEENNKAIGPQDLIDFGLIPECVGRLQVIAVLNELSVDELVRVLTEPVNSLVSEYKKLFELDGVELKFQPKALRIIAQQAYQQGTGARGLRALLERILLSTMFEIPSRQGIKKCIVTPAAALNQEPPVLIYEEAQVSAQ